MKSMIKELRHGNIIPQEGSRTNSKEMNVIKELRHGNIIPGEDSRNNSKEIKELLGYMSRHHEDFEKSFSDE